MTETFDIAIVGAGITGCAIARQLTRYDLSICVVEAANDIALGASKANGGLVHAGYDPVPGTVKAQVNARGCELYGTWAQELGFLFCRTGSMVLGFSDEDRAQLEKLRSNGLANGVPELSIIGPERIHELEPRASAKATCALWCPSTGFVDPFEVAIAALENAVANGVRFMRSAPVEAIEVTGGEATDGAARFTLATPAGDVRCRYLINAAGNGAADISHMAGAEEFQMAWRQGNIVVLDKESRALMPLYPVPTPVSKGVIVTGTVHGNTVITATAAVREPGDTQTYASDVNALLTGARKLVPDLDTRRVVRVCRRASGHSGNERLLYWAVHRGAGAVPGGGHSVAGRGERAGHCRTHGARDARSGRCFARAGRLGSDSPRAGRLRPCAACAQGGAHRVRPCMGADRLPLRDGARGRDCGRDSVPPGRGVGRGRQAPLPCRHGSLPERLLPEPRGGDPGARARLRP